MIETCEPAKHLFISVPSYAHAVHPFHSRSLAYATAHLYKRGISFTLDTVPGNCYLDHTRDRIANRFMDSVATDLLMIDADVEFEPRSVVEIAEHKRPLIAGAYRLKNDKLEFPIGYLEKGKVTVTKDGLVEMSRLPTGFMRINRAVFTLMDRGTYTFGDDDTKWHSYFVSGIENGKYWGEDIRFCRDWQEKGGKLHMLPDAKFTHWGMNGWEGNWREWIEAELKKQEAGDK